MKMRCVEKAASQLNSLMQKVVSIYHNKIQTTLRPLRFFITCMFVLGVLFILCISCRVVLESSGPV